MSSRRSVLQSVSTRQAEHAGLWLDKFITGQQRNDAGTKQVLVAETAQIAVPDAYIRFYERWRRTLDGNGTQVRYATVTGRIVIGLGAESVLETAVTLHHTYGVPYIPGSALKGLAAAYARQRLDANWRKPEMPSDVRAENAVLSPYEILFGTTASAGYVTFFDALYVPGTGTAGRPLHSDVLTVHHQEYYGGKADASPADWDSPIPVPFLSATGGYLVALGGAPAWVERAFQILGLALTEMGVGAKTSSGYGRMQLRTAPPETSRPLTRRHDTPSPPPQQPSPEPTPPPRPTTPSGPQVGSVYGGRVAEVGSDAVRIDLEGLAPSRFIGVLTAEHWEGKRYKVGNPLRVEVIKVRTRKDGVVILELKRATRT